MRKITCISAAIGVLFASAVSAQMTKAEMEQIDEGFRVFMVEEFDGNGRTCGTCHIPDESYNIFPHTIKHMKRKDRDKVFAINVPGLENIDIIVARGLFNVSGSADACRADIPGCWGAEGEEHSDPIFRGSMGLHGMKLTSKPSDNYPGTPMLPIECSTGVTALLPQIGWAGDGSPGTSKMVDDPATTDVDESYDCQINHDVYDFDADGSFRAFATGAILQHFTGSLDRIPGSDFRFATAAELDAMEAFTLWLGRRALNAEENAIQGTVNATEFDVKLLDFKDARVALGREHFIREAEFQTQGRGDPEANNPDSGSGCDNCHVNGGAITQTAGGGDGSNVQAETQVEPSSEAIGLAVVGVPLPHDPGGSDSIGRVPENTFDDDFNVQSIIESAEKRAWFHNHKTLDSLEESILHYTSSDFIDNVRAFTTLDAMQNGNVAGTVFFPNSDGIDHLGAFLRTLNALYALRDCERLIVEAIDRIAEDVPVGIAIDHCMFNLDDARRVLEESNLPFLYKNVQTDIGPIKAKLAKAAKKKSVKLLEDSISSIRSARDAIAVQMSP